MSLNRRDFLEYMGVLGASAVLPACAKSAKKDTFPKLTDREQCLDAITKSVRTAKDLPPGFEWIAELPDIDVTDIKLYPESPHTVIYARDLHMKETMAQVAEVMKQAASRGPLVVGLEGLSGTLSPEKRPMLIAEATAYRDKIHKIALTHRQFFPFGLSPLAITPEVWDKPWAFSPGVRFLLFMKELGINPTCVCGADDENLYRTEILYHLYEAVMQLDTVATCFSSQELRETLPECLLDVPKKDNQSDPSKNDLEYFKKKIDEARHELKKRFPLMQGREMWRAQEKRISHERGAIAAQNFLATLRREKIPLGMLIFGSFHSPEIRAALNQSRTSHLVIQTKVIGDFDRNECE